MRLLIIKPSSLGDVLHGLRVVAQLKSLDQGIEVDWVIKRGLEGILQASAIIDEIFIFERGRGLYEYLRLLGTIRRKQYDYVLDLQGLLRSAILTRFSKARHKIGRADGREFSPLFYEPIGEKCRRKPIHAIERLLPFLKEVGLQEYDPSLPLRFPNSHLSKELEDLIQGDGFVLLFPESRRPEKVWRHFFALGKTLSHLSHTQVVVAGNEKVGEFPGAVDLRENLGLCELPDLINRAKVVVANDSAPLHLASALDRPLVGLFGPTECTRYGPYPLGRSKNVILQGKDGDIDSICVNSVSQAVTELNQ